MISFDVAARPWLAHYEPGVPHEFPPPSGALHGFLAAAAGAAPGFPAVTFLGRTRSYGELFAQVGRAAGAMARDGVLPGSVVLISVPPCPAQSIAIYAALAIGAVALVIDPDGSTGAEHSRTPDTRTQGDYGSHNGRRDDVLTELLARHDPALVVLQPGRGPVGEAIEALRSNPRIVAVHPASDASRVVAALGRLTRRSTPTHGTSEWKKWLARARAPVTWPEVSPDDPAVAVRTEDGGVLVVSHRQAAAGAAMLRAWLADAVPGRERWLVAAPLHGLLGLTAALGAAVDMQAELVLLTTSDAATLRSALDAYAPSFAVATSGARWPGPEAGGLRAWITTGDDQGQPICRGWQPDSAAGLVACAPANGEHPPGSCGLPLPGAAVRVVGAAGGVLPPGHDGELQVRAPNMPWPDRWVPARATGMVDERGYVFLEHSAAGTEERRIRPA